MNKLNYLAGTLGVVGTLCFVYYIIIVIYAGFHTAFGWFWAFGGSSCITVAVIFRFIARTGWQIPDIIAVPVVSLFIAGVLLFLVVETAIIVHASVKPQDNADYMLVLGAQVRGTTITKSLKKRLDSAAVYLVNNQRTLVVVSGGQGSGEDISEAEAMQSYLLKKGIDKNRILMENQSTNTHENILYSKKLIKGNNKNIVIVTNGFHIFRATSLAKKQNIGHVEGLAAPTDSILRISYYVREALAVVKDKLAGNI